MAYNFLVVDDSAMMRAVIVKALSIARIPTGQVFQAANGQEGLDILKKEWVDLVFADINMPIMNGIELVNHMAEDDVLRNTPVVIISTERSETRMEELRKAGVRAILNKPFTPEMLKEVVDSVLEQKP